MLDVCTKINLQLGKTFVFMYRKKKKGKVYLETNDLCQTVFNLLF